MTERQCVHCQQPYTPKQKNQRFCSYKCSNNAAYKSRPWYTKVQRLTLQCQHCKGEFKGLHTTRFCSKSCQAKDRYRRRKPRRCLGACDGCGGELRSDHGCTKYCVSCKRLSLRISAYGLRPQEYHAMAQQQGGRCAVCGEPPKQGRLAVDHCHTTGDVRGLLCVPCNAALGLLKDSPARMRRAVKYLEQRSIMLPTGKFV